MGLGAGGRGAGRRGLEGGWKGEGGRCGRVFLGRGLRLGWG